MRCGNVGIKELNNENIFPSEQVAARSYRPRAPRMCGLSNHAHALTQTYRNATYHFSLLVPIGFKATELPMLDPGASTTVFIQNENGDGIQIRISSWDEPAGDLTQESITSDTGLSVIDPQPVLIPGAVGINFKSDNPAFDGDSREVWFVYKSNIYQISTYARDDGLLQSELKTWTFL
jgi:hypothetical protein